MSAPPKITPLSAELGGEGRNSAWYLGVRFLTPKMAIFDDFGRQNRSPRRGKIRIFTNFSRICEFVELIRVKICDFFRARIFMRDPATRSLVLVDFGHFGQNRSKKPQSYDEFFGQN